MQNQKTSKTIFIILVTLFVVGGGAMFIMKGASSPAVSGEAVAVPRAESSTGSTMSLKDILAMTTPTKCDVTSTNDKVDSTGSVYVSGGMMRTDFTSTAKTGPLIGKLMVAHMIIDADMSYMWGEGETKIGIKIPRKDVLDVAPEAGNSPANQAAVDINEKSDYHCTAWAADKAEFTPPTNISFNDVSAMMKMIPKSSTTASSKMTPEQLKQMCGACDSAGAGKASCLAQLGCK